MNIFSLDADECDRLVSKLDHGISVYILDMLCDILGVVDIQAVDAALDLQHVPVMEAHHDVLATVAVELEQVVSGPADHGVAAFTADHVGVAGAADEKFVATAGNDGVVAAAADQRVVPGSTLQVVVALATIQEVAAARGDQSVIAAAAQDGVMTGARALD